MPEQEVTMNYPEHTHRKRGLQTAQVVQVIRTESVIGTGEENDPCRRVVEYFTFKGKKIGTVDAQDLYENHSEWE